ncbi:hypothetical protein NQ317_017314 [Molorchus minor]|uniref:AP-3 complex subunit delta domain-containing protein n=1 Tax=Molorchus minor TaxID=1323400 RepID=A0ABQ9K1D9_9CUCU|nr:hypothetical protein NQ317_017314 [Molorchus minor]
MKIFAHVVEKYELNHQYDEIIKLCDLVIEKMSESIKSGELEVQERASTSLMIMKIVQDEITAKMNENCSRIDNDEPSEGRTEDPEATVASELLSLFSGELNPVAPKAQKKVPVPEGLDLDAWINEPIEEESDSDSEPEITENLFREARRHEQQNNPHYLKSISTENSSGNGNDVIENIPVAEIALNVPLKVIGQKRSDKYFNTRSEKKKSKKKSKKKHRTESSSDENANEGPIVEIKRDMELPEGATLSDSDSDHAHQDDPHRALDIDLDLPAYDYNVKTEPEKKAAKEKEKHTKKKTDKDKSSKKKSHKRKEKSNGEQKESLLVIDNETNEKELTIKKVKKDKKERKRPKTKENKSKSKKQSSGYEEALGISTPSKEFQ